MSEPSLGPGRREARERALELLFEREARALTAADLLAQLPLEPAPYAVAAVTGAERDAVAIDALIEDNTDGWSVERLPSVDRAILRLAVWELTTQPDVPSAVVINEAVELAKDYSTERSSGFINGVLDTIASLVRS